MFKAFDLIAYKDASKYKFLSFLFHLSYRASWNCHKWTTLTKSLTQDKGKNG